MAAIDTLSEGISKHADEVRDAQEAAMKQAEDMKRRMEAMRQKTDEANKVRHSKRRCEQM